VAPCLDGIARHVAVSGALLLWCVLLCCRLFRQVTGLIAQLHAAGIAHCDIKPANVLLLERPESGTGVGDVAAGRAGGMRPLLADFSEARVGDDALAGPLPAALAAEAAVIDPWDAAASADIAHLPPPPPLWLYEARCGSGCTFHACFFLHKIDGR
jgi:serine/threonine protein kinase